MQLDFTLADVPSTRAVCGNNSTRTARDAVIDALAQAIAKLVTQSHPDQRENDDE